MQFHFTALKRMQDLDISKALRKSYGELDAGSPFSHIGVKHLLEEAHSELLQYDKEIKSLQKRVALLQAEKDALQAYTEVCSSFQAPIRRLPSEILQIIFQLAMEEGYGVVLSLGARTEYDEQATPSTRNLERNYINVCSRWRDLAMTTPALWNEIRLVIAGAPTIPSDIALHHRRVKLLEEVLSRSRSAPLHMTLALDDSIDDMSPETIGPLVGEAFENLVETHLLNRCVGLHVDSLGIAPFFLRKSLGPWRSLYHLSAAGDCFDEPVCEDFAAQMPNLRALGANGPMAPFRSFVNKERLQHLETEWWTISQAHVTLQDCVNLQTLRLMNPEMPLVASESNPTNLVILPRLTSLNCLLTESHDSPAIATLMKSLQYPILQEVIVTVGEKNSHQRPAIRELAYSLTRSGCCLTEMYLLLDGYYMPEVCDLLKACPTITSLDITLNEGLEDDQTEDENNPVQNRHLLLDMFNRMIAQPGHLFGVPTATPILLPRLENFAFAAWFHMEFSIVFGALINAVCSRWHPSEHLQFSTAASQIACLRSIAINTEAEQADLLNVCRPLAPMEAEGLRVELQDNKGHCSL